MSEENESKTMMFLEGATYVSAIIVSILYVYEFFVNRRDRLLNLKRDNIRIDSTKKKEIKVIEPIAKEEDSLEFDENCYNSDSDDNKELNIFDDTRSRRDTIWSNPASKFIFNGKVRDDN